MAGGHRRQESMYAMTGLYSEPEGDSEPGTSQESRLASADQKRSIPSQTADHPVKCHSRNLSSGLDKRNGQAPIFPEHHIKCHTRNLSSGFIERRSVPPLEHLVKCHSRSPSCGFIDKRSTPAPLAQQEHHIKCHSRTPSAGFIDSSERAKQETKEKCHSTFAEVAAILPQDIRDCGIMACRPFLIQSCANIKIRARIISMLKSICCFSKDQGKKGVRDGERKRDREMEGITRIN